MKNVLHKLKNNRAILCLSRGGKPPSEHYSLFFRDKIPQAAENPEIERTPLRSAAHLLVRPCATRMKAITLIFLILAINMLINSSHVYAGQPVGPQTKLLEAPTTINVAGVPLSFEPMAYLNLMPRLIISPDHNIDCTKEGQLIVPIRISTSTLPAGTQIETVWVHSDGNWWFGKFNADETRKEGDHLVMTARGCPTPSFKPGTFVDVIVGVQHEQTIHYLRAPKWQLEAAY